MKETSWEISASVFDVERSRPDYGYWDYYYDVGLYGAVGLEGLFEWLIYGVYVAYDLLYVPVCG